MLLRVHTFVLILLYSLGAEEQMVSADPEAALFSYEFSGAVSVKAGGTFDAGRFSASGFLQARNETRFHQLPFPNHNWRGFVKAGWNIWTNAGKRRSIACKISAGHESAHATMGISKPVKNAFYMIYDNSDYRTMMLNFAETQLAVNYPLKRTKLTLYSSARYYFASKNTPELSGNISSQTLGGSVSGVWQVPAGSNWTFVFSFFERYIFAGNKKTENWIYLQSASGPVKKMQVRKVLSEANTIALRAGWLYHLPKAQAVLSIDAGWLYGSIQGYVDSREKRSVYSAAFSLKRSI